VGNYVPALWLDGTVLVQILFEFRQNFAKNLGEKARQGADQLAMHFLKRPTGKFTRNPAKC
jgi:hypothetical protein